MGWNSFLDSVETRLASVSGISYASRAASLDPEKLLKIPRWPAGLVVDMGGMVNPFSGEIAERLMSIVIAVFKPRGTLGKEAAKQLGTLSEAVVEEFTHTDENSSIRVLSESDEIAEQVGSGEVYMRAITFSYDILR